LNGVLLKKYSKHPAHNQVTLLQSFEELSWADVIDDPLNPGKLGPTVRDLNRALGTDCPLVFSRDGTGKRVKWAVRTV
jgi:hypothetical protein